jgi:uncharacterized membrane protein YkoI
MKFPRTLGKTKGVLAASALVLAGFGGGAVLAATGTADAVTGSSSSSSTTGHSGETALTGTTAAKVKAAALAKYPGATIERVETDSDGVYEAHLTTQAGDEITVQVNKSFAVTGTATGGHGGHGGHGNETALIGTTATKVKVAALAKYPGATIERVETDSDGVYEAHLTTKAGDEITVQVDKSFTVTGTRTGGGHDDHDGDATDSSPSTS